ncbi:uncharacterized protein BDR25DRAFT_353061 [Lindgomyces ingoldianus]|uniref:Uncharacterized protein n=1 Tax=Lindgomyces ingoldianus TaxID=673940 RepID=A0ACB6R0R9_9PLEO|nr:uncharacterized protein BDR25DRAFT_353061 [Lindgomyces ingoldianus]KAF2472736.1 hypothetical protein BDR25DRAFT_353061 [Lindgomyces ingoldianus]
MSTELVTLQLYRECGSTILPASEGRDYESSLFDREVKIGDQFSDFKVVESDKESTIVHRASKELSLQVIARVITELGSLLRESDDSRVRHAYTRITSCFLLSANHITSNKDDRGSGNYHHGSNTMKPLLVTIDTCCLLSRLLASPLLFFLQKLHRMDTRMKLEASGFKMHDTTCPLSNPAYDSNSGIVTSQIGLPIPALGIPESRHFDEHFDYNIKGIFDLISAGIIA